MNYTTIVKDNIRKYPELKIIDAYNLYKEKFNNIPEQAYFKIFSRMVKAGEIKRISKGVYSIPKKGRFGIIDYSEKNIIKYYIGKNKNKGVVVGYRMYNKYKLTTQISKYIKVYSNVVMQKNKNIKNVIIHKANIDFNEATIRLIELLEILQNYKMIEDLNYGSLLKLIKVATKYYDSRVLDNIVNVINYKKSTLASFKNVLDYNGIENTIDDYLNETSKYDALRMEDLNKLTQ